MVRKWFITLKMRICHQEALHFSKRRWCVIPLMIWEYPTILHCCLFSIHVHTTIYLGYNNDKIVCSTKHWMDAVSTKCDFHPWLVCIAYPSQWMYFVYIIQSSYTLPYFMCLTECFIFGWRIELHAERNSKYIRIAIWVHHPEIIESSILLGKK